MKTFTYPQKKWVMTAALLAVLGLNVSFNSQTGGVASADFASTSGDLVESKVYTSEGAMPVKYINNGETQVLAIVPKKMTEGKVCDNCGYETIPLTVQNKSDIDSLNVALMKVLGTKNQRTEVTHSEEEVQVDSDAADVKKRDPFARIKRTCEISSEKLACHKKAYLEILKDPKKSKNISADEALEFYLAEIQPQILNQMSEARRISAAARRAQVDARYWNSHAGSDDFSTDPNEIIRNTLYAIEDLIRGVPAKFETVRQKVLIAETEVLKIEAAHIKETQAQAELNKGSSEGLILTQEASMKYAEMEALQKVFTSLNKTALSEAVSSKTLTEGQKTAYEKFMLDFNVSLLAALAGNGNMLDGIKTTPSLDLSGRLKNPGRGTGAFNNIGTLPNTSVPTSQIGTLPSNSNPLSSRTGSRGQ